MDWIYKLYHKVEKWKIVKLAVKVYRKGFFLENINADKRLIDLRDKVGNHMPIRVAFIGQSTTCWNKLKPLYEKMSKDDKFQTYLLAVPDDVSKSNDGVYDYFYNLYKDAVIKADMEDRYFNLKELMPDYVFYQRPYDRYLPKEYRSNIVSRYAKVCYLPYGFMIFGGMDEISMPHQFHRNAYMYFAESSLTYQFNKNRYAKSSEQGFRNSYDLGYPSLEDFVNQKEQYPAINDGKFRVLWTPRWSENVELGGSSFLKYKDEVVKLVDKNDRMHIVFRPHPMTFNHFIEVGKITKEEADAYIQLYKESDKLEQDTRPEYAKSMWESDALLTDMSSIIIEYFLSGKPIVFCETGSKVSSAFAEMQKGMYIANSWTEAQKYLLDLSEGKDPLKEKRIAIRDKMFGNSISGSVDRIMDTIEKDFKYVE